MMTVHEIHPTNQQNSPSKSQESGDSIAVPLRFKLDPSFPVHLSRISFSHGDFSVSTRFGIRMALNTN
jgi:hypothetical protein